MTPLEHPARPDAGAGGLELVDEKGDAAGRGHGPGERTGDVVDVVGRADAGGAMAVVDHELSAAAAALVAEALAPNTRRAYRRWVTRWDTWCATTGRTALPGTAVSMASWVAELVAEGQSPASIGQAIGAVRSAHDLAGHPDTPGKAPAAKALRAHRRRLADQGRRPRQAAPLVIERLTAITETLDPTRVIDARDRALLVIGFAGCLRRSNLVALDRDDLVIHRDRLEVTLRRSKTDQDAHGRTLDLPLGSRAATCPVRALEVWLAHLDAAGHRDDQDDNQQVGRAEVGGGPVFRAVDKTGHISSGRLSARSASRVVARRARAAGLSDLQFSGHSLRAGGATSMAATGATTAEIADHGGWSPRSAVVHDYVRRDEAWRRNAMRNVL